MELLQAMVGAGSFCNSFVSSSGQLLLLCHDSLRSLSVRTWHERIDYLVSASKYDDALRLGVDMYTGKVKQSSRGAPDMDLLQTKVFTNRKWI